MLGPMRTITGTSRNLLNKCNRTIFSGQHGAAAGRPAVLYQQSEGQGGKGEQGGEHDGGRGGLGVAVELGRQDIDGR